MGEPQLSSRRRWSAIGGVIAAAMFIGVAVHVHSMSSDVALASTVAARAKASGASQLFRGSFQRAAGVTPKDYNDVKIDEASYISGEQHVMNDLFKQQKAEDSAVKNAFYHARDKMSRVLEASIEKQEEREKFLAVEVERRKHWVLPERVDSEIKSMYKDIYHSHLLMNNFNKLGEKVRDVEDAICDGRPCKHWHNLLDSTQTKVKDLEHRLAHENEAHTLDLKEFRGRDNAMDESKARAIKDISNSGKEMQHWKDLAAKYQEEYQEELKKPPPPPPPPPPPKHCKGLVTMYGSWGAVDTGGPATDLQHNDCRWLIKSSSSAVVLHFPDFHVKGDEGRVSIFVGPENVALYKNEDVINWASAFKSFTGEAYPAPIVCPSSEVLVVFKTDAHNAAKSNLKMTWGPAVANEVTTKESLAVLKTSTVTQSGTQQVLLEKPLVVVHHESPKAHESPKVAAKVAPKVAVKVEESTGVAAEKKMVAETRIVAVKKASVVVRSVVGKTSVAGHGKKIGEQVKSAKKTVVGKKSVEKRFVAQTWAGKKSVAAAHLQAKAKAAAPQKM